jgi:hypothetical protein
MKIPPPDLLQYIEKLSVTITGDLKEFYCQTKVVICEHIYNNFRMKIMNLRAVVHFRTKGHGVCLFEL